MQRGWLTLDSIPARKTVAITLPDNEQWRAQFLGALLLLSGAENWELFGELTPEQMAAEWLDIVFQFTSGETTMLPTGVLMPFGGSDIPDGFLLCDGAAISRATYSALFAIVGVAYGPGDGSTTFNIPDMRERVPVGRYTNWSEFDTLGKTGGVRRHTLTVVEMPSHTHLQNPHTHIQGPHSHAPNPATLFNITGPVGWTVSGSNMTIGGNGNTSQNATATNQNTTAENQVFGGGGAHENMPPFAIVNYIIKY